MVIIMLMVALIMAMVIMVMIMFMIMRVAMVIAVVVMVLMIMCMRVLMISRTLVLVVRVHRSPVDAKLYPFDILPFAALEMHVEITDFHLGQFPLESGRLDSQVAQCADSHVAANSRKTIQKEDTHGQDKQFPGGIRRRIERSRPE